MDNARGTRGIRIAASDGDEWTLTTYPQLAILTRQAAARLAAAGVRGGDYVVIGCPTSIDFVAYFYGALMLGATPAPVAPPTAFGDRRQGIDRVAQTVRLLRARALATTSELAEFMATALESSSCVLVTGEDEGVDGVTGPPQLPETGLVQFSSGSTGAPKGVRISLSAVESQIRMLTEWLGITTDDPFATWLPMHHDMGLIGMLLTPMSHGSDIWLMQPQHFIRSPARWLRRFGENGCAITAAPGFALAHVTRRVRETDLAGWDFSGWTRMVVGAEPVDPEAVRSFAAHLEPAGFAASTVMPAYGMAEATLAVTGPVLGAPPSSVAVDPSSLRLGEPMRPAGAGESRVELADCGRPVPGTAVSIVDEEGFRLPEGVLGEIEVASPSLGDAWISDASGDVPIPRPLRTGDAGFLLDGQLYVLGRLGDGVKSHGRWIAAEEIQGLAARASPRPLQTVAVLGVLAGRNTAFVVVEGKLSEPDAERIGAAITAQHTSLDVAVIDAPAGWIDRTTSGKPKRRVVWKKIVADELRDRVRLRADALSAADKERGA
jgi:acyl-CoA synthetase (AMP-forming)/AMP-acid ligase II